MVDGWMGKVTKSVSDNTEVMKVCYADTRCDFGV